MTTAQVDFTEAELLADHDYVEPLVVGGVRCHGGFDDDGTYVSPRTANRWPAIEAWEAQRRRAVRHRRCSTSRSRPGPRASPTSSRPSCCCATASPEPTVSELTRIGTVEGFGAMLRNLPMPDVARGTSTRTSTAPPSPTSAAGCSRRTPATRPASRTRPGTTACGSSPATSPSRTRSPTTQTALMLARMGIDPTPKTAEQLIALRDAAMANRRAARRHRLHARDGGRADDRAAADRDLRLPRLPVGRGRAVRHRALAGEGEAARLVSLHPRRRDARTSPTCAPR